MVVIFMLSSRPRFTATGGYTEDFLIFKTLHACEYGYLALLMFNASYKTVARKLPHAIGLAGLLSMAYAATDELHQLFIPTRSGTLRDIFIDSIGIVVVLFIIHWQWPTLKKRF